MTWGDVGRAARDFTRRPAYVLTAVTAILLGLFVLLTFSSHATLGCEEQRKGWLCVREWLGALGGWAVLLAAIPVVRQVREARRASAIALRPMLEERVGRLLEEAKIIRDLVTTYANVLRWQIPQSDYGGDIEGEFGSALRGQQRAAERIVEQATAARERLLEAAAVHNAGRIGRVRSELSKALADCEKVFREVRVSAPTIDGAVSLRDRDEIDEIMRRQVARYRPAFEAARIAAIEAQDAATSYHHELNQAIIAIRRQMLALDREAGVAQ